MPELSIITPVYNTGIYLETCIKSILEQTFTDFELLLIDDASTDNSLYICKQYEKIDKRIIVISIDHGGSGKARNVESFQNGV